MTYANARFTSDTSKLVEMALREALQLGHNLISPEHLLLALVRLATNGGSTVATRALVSTCSVAELRKAVLAETTVTFKDKPKALSRFDALRLAIDNASTDANPEHVVNAAEAYLKYLDGGA